MTNIGRYNHTLQNLIKVIERAFGVKNLTDIKLIN